MTTITSRSHSKKCNSKKKDLETLRVLLCFICVRK